MIDEITKLRIVETARIDEVISDFISLKKRGSNYIGLCPFHKEKTPSFMVSPVKGIYKCFGCGKAGNSVNFVMEHDHLSYPEALKWLAKKYHIEIVEKEISPEEVAKRDERESLFVAIAFAHSFFLNSLHNSQEGKAVGLSYFSERGFREDIIKKFELGFSSEKSDTFYKHAINSGFKIDVLQKAGLINKGNYDSFSGRVIFPLHNLSGKVVGFTGRILNSEKSPVKYYNSPESEIFHKGKILFGLFLAKKAIVENDRCYLVEGNTDVIALHQAGIENCVATSGTALTIDQVSLIKRFTKNITILYDGDEAGIKAALRGIEIFLEEGLNVKVVLLPDGNDPDSYCKAHTASEVASFLKTEEKDFFAFKTNIMLRDAKNDPVKKSLLLNDLARNLALVPDNILRSLYIKECSKQLKVDEQLMHSEVAKLIVLKRTDSNTYKPVSSVLQTQPQTPQIPSIVDDFYAENQEFEIIRLIFKYGNNVLYKEEGNVNGEDKFVTVAEFIINELLNDELKLKNLVYLKVFELLINQLKERNKIEVNDFVYHSDEDIHELAASMLSIPYYNANVKGQSDILSDYYKKMGIQVKLEDENLGLSVNETIIRYKIKILEITRNDRMEKLKMAQETSDSSEIQDQILNEIIAISNGLRMLYNKIGQIIC